MFLLWNIDTLAAHILFVGIPENSLYMPSNIFEHALLPPITAKELLYYVLRNDHLLCIPAMLFLVLSLRAFSSRRDKDENAPINGHGGGV